MRYLQEDRSLSEAWLKDWDSPVTLNQPDNQAAAGDEQKRSMTAHFEYK